MHSSCKLVIRGTGRQLLPLSNCLTRHNTRLASGVSETESLTWSAVSPMPSLQAQAIYSWNTDGFYFYHQPGFSASQLISMLSPTTWCTPTRPDPGHESLSTARRPYTAGHQTAAPKSAPPAGPGQPSRALVQTEAYCAQSDILPSDPEPEPYICWVWTEVG
jgi:hypothetical protein